jgi:hypothetical protein
MFASSGSSVILDGNFNTPGHADPVRAFVQSHDTTTVEVCLWGDPNVLRARFVERADPPLTDDLLAYFEEVLYRPREPVLPLPAPVLHIDTTDFNSLETEYPHLLRSIREGTDP